MGILFLYREFFYRKKIIYSLFLFYTENFAEYYCAIDYSSGRINANPRMKHPRSISHMWLISITSAAGISVFLARVITHRGCVSLGVSRARARKFITYFPASVVYFAATLSLIRFSALYIQRLPRGWHVLRTGWQGSFLSRERGWIQRGIQATPAAQSADEGSAAALPPGVGRPAGQFPAVAHQYLRTGEHEEMTRATLFLFVILFFFPALLLRRWEKSLN